MHFSFYLWNLKCSFRLVTEACFRVSVKFSVSVGLRSIRGINKSDRVAVSIITIKSFALLGSFLSKVPTILLFARVVVLGNKDGNCNWKYSKLFVGEFFRGSLRNWVFLRLQSYSPLKRVYRGVCSRKFFLDISHL
jgi:hypothetical protein